MGRQDLQSTTAKHIRAMENVAEVHVFADVSTQLPHYQIRRQWSDLLPQHTVVVHAWLFADTLRQVVAGQERKVHANKFVLTPPQPVCVVFDSNLERTCWLDYPGDSLQSAEMTQLVIHAKSLNISFFTCHHSAIHPWLPVDVVSVSSCMSDDTVLQDVFDRTQWSKREPHGPFRNRFPSNVCMPFRRSKFWDAPDWYVFTLVDHQVYRERTADRVLYLQGLWVPRPAASDPSDRVVCLDQEVVVVPHPGLAEAGIVGEPSTVLDGSIASSSSSSIASPSLPRSSTPLPTGNDSVESEAVRALAHWASQSFVELCMQDAEGHTIVTEVSTPTAEPTKVVSNAVAKVTEPEPTNPAGPASPIDASVSEQSPSLPISSQVNESPSPEVINVSASPPPVLVVEDSSLNVVVTQEMQMPCNESPVPCSPVNDDDDDDVLFPPTPPSSPASPGPHAVESDCGTVILLGSDHHDEEHVGIMSPPPPPPLTSTVETGAADTSTGVEESSTTSDAVGGAATTWWPGSWLGSWSKPTPQ